MATLSFLLLFNIDLFLNQYKEKNKTLECESLFVQSTTKLNRRLNINL